MDCAVCAGERKTGSIVTVTAEAASTYFLYGTRALHMNAVMSYQLTDDMIGGSIGYFKETPLRLNASIPFSGFIKLVLIHTQTLETFPYENNMVIATRP
jgi:hypothetical protein